MSRPPLDPAKTAAGIALDPQTLDRVVPESRRPDGTVRKQLKIRPGFTPQEDVQRFRGKKQAQMDSNALPKGHIIGWVPPSSATSSKPMPKSAKKNAKRKEKKAQEKAEEAANAPVPDNWDDDEEDGATPNTKSPGSPASKKPIAEQTSAEDLAKKLDNLEV